jgi:uncharacterized protein (DUF3820 family)
MNIPPSIHKMNSKQFTPKRVLNPETLSFELGKYRGRSLADVKTFDPSYIGWMRVKPWAIADKALMESIKDFQVPDITFGKHKGRTLEWLMEHDEAYVQFLWSSDYVREKHPALKEKLDAIYL